MLDNTRQPERTDGAVVGAAGPSPGGKLLLGLVEALSLARAVILLVLMPWLVGLHAVGMFQKWGVSRSGAIVGAGLLTLCLAFVGLLIVLRFAEARLRARRQGADLAAASEARLLRSRGLLVYQVTGAVLIATYMVAAGSLNLILGLSWGSLATLVDATQLASGWQSMVAALWYMIIPPTAVHWAWSAMLARAG